MSATRNPDGGAVSSPHPNIRRGGDLIEEAGLVKIAGYEVTEGTLPKFDFQAIPQDFMDLVVKFAIRTNVNNTFDNMDTRFNADAVDANYHEFRMQWINNAWQAGQALVAGEANMREGFLQPTGATAPVGNFTEGQITLPGYSRSDNRKYAQIDRYTLQLSNLAGGAIPAKLGVLTRISTLEPINRLEFDPMISDFVVGSYMHLYGVMPGFM